MTQEENKKYARKCDATGEGMNDGIVYLDGEKYFKDIKTFVKFLRSQGGKGFNDVSDQYLVNESYALGEHYYTEWEDEDDFQYQMIDGELVEIED